MTKAEMDEFISNISEQVMALNDALVVTGEAFAQEYPNLGIETMVTTDEWWLLVGRVHQLLEAVDPDGADVLQDADHWAGY